MLLHCIFTVVTIIIAVDLLIDASAVVLHAAAAGCTTCASSSAKVSRFWRDRLGAFNSYQIRTFIVCMSLV